MSKLKQKTISLILALIMLFGTILSTNSISYAEKATRTWIPGLYYHSNNKGFYGQFPHIKIGGEDVFCVQPSVEVQPGEGYTSTTDVRSIMNQKQKENIELIHHYGYTLSKKTGKDYAFTQLAIWRELGHSISIGTSRNSSNLNSEYTTWRNKIQEKINALYKVPSWNGKTIKFTPGKTITLDGEGKIEGSFIIKNNGNVVELKNGKISIIAKSKGKINFQKYIKDIEKYKGTTLLYKKPRSQTVSKIKYSVDPVNFSINLDLDQGQVRIKKLDKDTQKELNGVLIGIYNEKEERVSGGYTGHRENGMFILDLVERFVDGRYYYMEEKSLDGYKLDKTKHYFTVKQRQATGVQGILYNEKEELPFNVELSKLGENQEKIEGAVLQVFKKENNQIVFTGSTDENGKVSLKLLAGDYYFIERQAPLGYILNSEKQYFNVSKDGKITGKTILKNNRKPYDVTLTKTDLTTGKPVEGATLEVYEKDTNKKVYTSITDKEGKLPGLKLVFGDYYFLEKNAPEGYVLNTEKQYFTVAKDGKVTGLTNLENKKQKATLKLKKIGNVLTGFANSTKVINGKTYNTKKFVYEKQIIGGAEFDLIKDGKVVKHIVTKNKQISEIENLNLGKYVLKETKAPKGYKLDTKEYLIEIKYAGQNVEVVSKEVERENEKTQLKVKINKKFEDSKLNKEKWAIFGLYTKDSKGGLPANTLVDVIKITGNTTGTFNNLANINYYVKEIEASKDYRVEEKQEDVEIPETNKDEEKVIDKENKLKKGQLEIIKKDSKTKEVLKDVEFSLYLIKDNKQEFLGTYKTNENGKISIKGLELGSYELKETKTQIGYELNNKPIKIEIKKDKEVVSKEIKNNRKPYDVTLTKTDLTTGNPVEGATLEVYEKGTNKKVYTSITDKEGKLPGLKLVFGDYYFLEKNAPEGYVLNTEKQYFTVAKDGKVTGHTNITNKKITNEVILTKKDTMNQKVVPGAEIEFINSKTKEVVFKGKTDKDGKIKLTLEYGEYVYHETVAPEGYVKADKYVKIKVDKDGMKVEQTLWNKPITSEIELTKKDTMNQKVVPGAEIEFIDSKTKKVVFKGKTDKDGKINVKLRFGKYVYHETVAPEGYVKADKYGEIVVNKDGAKIEQILWNKPITSDYELTKKDTITKKNIEGAEVEIKNAETNEIVFKGKTDKNGKIKVRLRYGKYILTETIAPEGYIKANKNLEIVVNKDGAKIEQILWNEPIPTQPEHLPKSGINKETGLLILVGLIIGCGLYFTKKAKKGDKYVRR